MVKNDGARISDAAIGSGEDAFSLLDFVGREVAIRLPVVAGGQPCGGNALGNDKGVSAAGRKLGSDGGRQVCRGGLNDFGVVLAQAMNHQLNTGLGRKIATADIRARQSRISVGELRGVPGGGGSGCVDAVETQLPGLDGLVHLFPFARWAHHWWKLCSGRPRKSRVWVHFAPRLGIE